MSSMQVQDRSPQVIDLDRLDRSKTKSPLAFLDADGDGVIDGEGLSDKEGGVQGADGIAQLRAQGLTLSPSGELASVDGFEIHAGNAAVVMDFDGRPTLPDDFVDAGSIVGMRDQLNWVQNTEGIADAALMWVQLSTMAETALKEMKDWTQLKHASQAAQSAAKTVQIDATEKKIEAGRQAAWEGLAFSVIGAVSSLVGGETIGKPLADTIGSVGDVVSKSVGGQSKADEQEIKGLRYESIEAQMEEATTSATTSYEDAKELFKLALKILDEHAERESQITSNMTRG